ncbi:hypothetical protein HAX54_006437, partial [Datura stramonium]|nr:hypothetical protein [Datura stramonium]
YPTMSSFFKPSLVPSLDQPQPMFVSPEILMSLSSQDQTPIIFPLANLPPPIKGELGLLVASSFGGSPGSSMATTHTSLFSNEGSASNPSPSSSVEVDLPSLLAYIQGRYTSKDTKPPPSSLTHSDPTGSSSTPTDSGKSPTTISFSDFASTNDSVPLAELKKGARKRLFHSYQLLPPRFLVWLVQRPTLGLVG